MSQVLGKGTATSAPTSPAKDQDERLHLLPLATARPTAEQAVPTISSQAPTIHSPGAKRSAEAVKFWPPKTASSSFRPPAPSPSPSPSPSSSTSTRPPTSTTLTVPAPHLPMPELIEQDIYSSQHQHFDDQEQEEIMQFSSLSTDPSCYTCSSTGEHTHAHAHAHVHGTTSTATHSRHDSPHSLPLPQAALPPIALHWFQMSSLRFHDNPALNHSLLSEPGTVFRAVFIIDPWFVRTGRFGINRWRFLLECLWDIDKRLRKMNTCLYVLRGQPTAALEQVFRNWNVQSLSFLVNGEPQSMAQQRQVEVLAESMSITVYKHHSHTLFDPEVVEQLRERERHPPLTTFKQFKSLVMKLGPPESPIEAQGGNSSSPSSSTQSSTPPLQGGMLNVSASRVFNNTDWEGEFQVPSLAEVGFPTESLYTGQWIGGETEALRRLPIYFSLRSRPPTNKVDTLFDKSSLSPYIRFGCLSVRYFLWKGKVLVKGNPLLEEVVKDLANKLLQREFYLTVASQVPHFDSCKGNPLCFQLPWERDSAMFDKWRRGMTGYPWIDAAMRQMRTEGWIHHCLRECVAAFLTRGDLWLNWVLGKDTFEEYMLDFEPSVSCGCWMKSSCSAFITPPIEHYSPTSFGQKLDPTGIYVRTYVPEVRKMPNRYVYSPWEAPRGVQEECGCVVGVDYPHPMVDHATAGSICCERLCYFMQSMDRTMSSSASASAGASGGVGVGVALPSSRSHYHHHHKDTRRSLTHQQGQQREQFKQQQEQLLQRQRLHNKMALAAYSVSSSYQQQQQQQVPFPPLAHPLSSPLSSPLLSLKTPGNYCATASETTACTTTVAMPMTIPSSSSSTLAFAASAGSRGREERVTELERRRTVSLTTAAATTTNTTNDKLSLLRRNLLLQQGGGGGGGEGREEELEELMEDKDKYDVEDDEDEEIDVELSS